MDDIINIVTGIKQILEMIKWWITLSAIYLSAIDQASEFSRNL